MFILSQGKEIKQLGVSDAQKLQTEVYKVLWMKESIFSR